MASTQVTVENLTLIPIYAVLTWGAEHIGDVVIQAPSPDADGMYDRGDFKSGSIPCEYVWYDLKVLDADRTNVSYTFCNCPGRVVRGSSWTADSDQDLDVLEERLDDVPMVLFGG